jgi:hypothetical protein
MILPVSQAGESAQPWGDVLTGWKAESAPSGRVISTPSDAAATQGR